MRQTLLEDKKVQLAALAVLFLSVIGFAFKHDPVYAALPFALLLVLATGANWKAVYWVLLFSIPVSIDVSLGDTLSTSLPDEPLMWLFFLLFLVLMARQPNMLPEWWLRHPVVLVIALQFVWTIVAVIYSHVPVLSLKWMAAKSWFLAAFFIFPIFIFKEKKDFKFGFFVMLVPLIGTMLFIFLRHAAIGFSFKRIEIAIGDLYYNHVDYSTVLSMFLPMVWVAYRLTRGRNPLVRIGFFLLALFFLPMIYLTFARAAMLAVLFAAAIGIAIRMRLVNFVMPAFYGFIALLMVHMVDNNKYVDYRPNYQRTFMRKNFTDHVVATFRGQDMSSMERIYRWIAAVRMSADEPIHGWGPNAFYYHYKPYAVPMFRTYVSRNFEHSTTHNYFLYMLAEQGYPAMILYAILVIAVFAVAQRAYHRVKDPFYRNCVLGAAMMFAAGFINNFFSELIETHKVGGLFYLSIALIVVLDRKSREDAVNSVQRTVYSE
jgi:O-antigen ligase